MNTIHAMHATAAMAAASSPSLSSSSQVLAGGDADQSLTRVSLAHLEQRINLYLRFGDPIRIVRLDRWRQVALFLPGTVFCRIRWLGNDYGTVRWQLMVMQACTPRDAAQRIPGVLPGARLLLHAEGERSVRAVLPLIDAIEALGIAPASVSPAYWHTLGNRLAARGALPRYSMDRHVAWLAGKELA